VPLTGRGSGRVFGSPMARLHAVHDATMWSGSSPVTSRPRVWCTHWAREAHTWAAAVAWAHHPSSWVRQAHPAMASRRRTLALVLRHAVVDPPTHDRLMTLRRPSGGALSALSRLCVARRYRCRT
jgi:hypothetical protein